MQLEDGLTWVYRSGFQPQADGVSMLGKYFEHATFALARRWGSVDISRHVEALEASS